MCFAQGHNELNAVVPVRLKLESLGLESSTLALSHCASFFFYYNCPFTSSICTEQKKKAYAKYSSANIHVHVRVTEYERLNIKIPVEGSFEFYFHFIPHFCLIFLFGQLFSSIR